MFDIDEVGASLKWVVRNRDVKSEKKWLKRCLMRQLCPPANNLTKGCLSLRVCRTLLSSLLVSRVGGGGARGSFSKLESGIRNFPIPV